MAKIKKILFSAWKRGLFYCKITVGGIDMVKVISDNISIERICHSGQCFRFKKLEQHKYCIIAFEKYLEIEQKQNEITFYCNQQEYDTLWKNYFDMDTDYNAMINTVPETDVYLKKAVQYSKGITILKQDTWEMIISSIISQQNNIKRIQKIIELLCQKYGQKCITQSGIVYYCFPTIQQLSQATEQQLYECNLGYRSKYILKTTQDILQNSNMIQNLKNSNYDQCKKELLKLYGVGEKVADCICLFGLHHLQAFPVDTHIKKVLKTHYPQGFPFALYKGYEGVIQQYLFYYDLYNKD